jgi:5-deoxy-glucuronate isomerase
MSLKGYFLILYGQIEIVWEGRTERVSRESFLDDNLWCLNVPKGVTVKVTGIAEDSEVAVIRTENDRNFKPAVRSGDAVIKEVRGKGSMNETGTRIVRTAQNVDLSPDSNIMFGEDVHYPGKWAGFPSHHHDQPEIYFYKLQPENGFGLMKLGDEAVLLEHNDTVKIAPNLVHPQVAAPGYAMYFLWVIRHQEGNPYIQPTFEEEHVWVEKPEAKYWPDK